LVGIDRLSFLELLLFSKNYFGGNLKNIVVATQVFFLFIIFLISMTVKPAQPFHLSDGLVAYIVLPGIYCLFRIFIDPESNKFWFYERVILISLSLFTILVYTYAGGVVSLEHVIREFIVSLRFTSVLFIIYVIFSNSDNKVIRKLLFE